METINAITNEFKQASLGDRIFYIGMSITIPSFLVLLTFAAVTGNLDAFAPNQTSENVISAPTLSLGR